MYFTDRAAAGRQLAERLLNYCNSKCVVVALSESSAVVAAQVALKLHAPMALYMIKNINLPNESDATAAVSSTGGFQYNSMYSPGEVEELAGEYRSFMDEQRIQKNHELNVLLGDSGAISKDMLRHQTVIVVADGIATDFTLNMIDEFLRSVAIKRFVVATPLASVEAIDHMHVVADELHCLSVPQNFMGTDHYYDKDGKTTVDDVMKMIKSLGYSWDRTAKPHAKATPNRGSHHDLLN